MTRITGMLLILFGLGQVSEARAEPYLTSLAPTYLPNYIGAGIGAYPDYLGSDRQSVGIAPFGRVSWGQRYLDFQVNFGTANLIEDRHWRFGPTALWRFGREDVEDPVVKELPAIDGAAELGLFVAYENVGTDPRDRWVTAAGFNQDVTGVHGGYTAWASARRWIPVGRYAALGTSLATTYGSSSYMNTYFSVSESGSAASGLPVFKAGSGVRDVRASLILAQALSRQWVVGAGVIYSRIMGDAADSPIVADRGSRDQFVYGLGFMRSF